MRIAIVLVLALATVAAAKPSTAKRKTAPDKFVKAAGEAFGAAYTADQNGDLPTALGLYQKAFAISPHPSTAYNIADIQRRLGRLTDAIRSFELYLALSPDAADRKGVEALVDQLAASPGSVFVMSGSPSDPKSIDLKTAYLLFDGKILVKPGTSPTTAVDGGPNLGFELDLPPGRYVMEAVTPLTYGMSTCIVRPGERRVCSIGAPPRTDGAVVISSDDRQLLVVADRTEQRQASSRVHKRFEHPPGRSRLLIRDHGFECAPLTFEVPKNGDVAYAFVRVVEPGSRPRCRTLDITKHRLRFDP